jgi:3-oxoacyl-[acyl-carrier-protein] synthase II
MKGSRVVITGMGVVSVLGAGLQTYWQNLLAGKSGISRITQFDASMMPCQIAGEINDFQPEDYMDRKEARRVPRSAQLGFAAARLAAQDAGFSGTLPNPERAGVSFGTAIGGLDRSADGIHVIRTQGYTRLNPFVVPTSLPTTPPTSYRRACNAWDPPTQLAQLVPPAPRQWAKGWR